MDQTASAVPHGRRLPLYNQPQHADGDEQDGNLLGFDLSAVLFALRRHWLAIVAFFVVAIILGVIATLLMTPVYTATSRVLVEQEADQIIEGSDTQPSVAPQDAERFLQTQVDIIQSRALAEKVIQNEGLSTDPLYFDALGGEYPTEETMEDSYTGPEGLADLREDVAIDLLQENMTATLPIDSRIVSISVETTDQALSARLSNSIAENYIAGNLDRRFDSSSYAREFLAQQLEEARENLAESERELNQYSRAAGLIRLNSESGEGQGGTLSVTNDTLISLNSAAGSARAGRIAAQESWQNIANQPLMSIPQVLENPAIQGLLRQKSEAEAQLAEERARHLDGHPTVIALSAQVDRIDEQINQVGRSIKDSVRTQYQSAIDRERALTGQVEQLRSAALDEQDRGVQYNVLKRVADTNRSLYDTLLSRFNELNATAGATSNNVSIVDRAEVPRKPTSPSLLINLILSLLGGGLFAAGYVALREHFDDVVRSPEDVERKLGMPMLGLIPRAEDADELAEARDDPKSSINEAYQSLVTNLFYATSTGLPDVLMVTSAQASEGKTTTSNAIARSIARLGKSVVLVDGDLRRPTLHKAIGKPDQSGLTEVLGGHKTVDEVLLPSEVEHLHYMTAMPIPPDPSLLLGSPRLEGVLDELRSRYDVVIVDCPPVLGLSDAVTWSAKVDGALLVVDSSRGQRGSVKASHRRLQLVDAPLLGVVLTKFDPDAAGGSYSYYGYGYYAYGED
ncbi:polysaccharide biosynthesis tyrosine autokinase [Qipengyuania sp. XHP0211]|uniref:GumC family protein n=1 Tax=Qipengyuania sp. XHP0211 TaxID=3038079 RepID=UPI00241FA8A8|nr:polysaccharide biosynthesis tyrosine autokinase [Qipengyuania sp. XHP0211]MDG5750971.1 polysaccharide biosynthesis tyrosine autokinase [Qipengyuania sp. XHP0211]